MILHADIDVARGAFALAAELSLSDGETLAVLGPNGAGKTTLLRVLAGLESLRSGRIVLDDEVLDDPREGVFVPAETRRVGVVFQDYLLFRHMSVVENVAFGPRARGESSADALARARELIDWVDLAQHANKRPSELSGGQAQRVALARALAITPRLLLLDEPLAALDISTRRGVRRELGELLRSVGGARVLVTHDPKDAVALADRIVIIEAGRVVQSGSIDAVAANPASDYVAELFGGLG